MNHEGTRLTAHTYSTTFHPTRGTQYSRCDKRRKCFWNGDYVNFRWQTTKVKPYVIAQKTGESYTLTERFPRDIPSVRSLIAWFDHSLIPMENLQKTGFHEEKSKSISKPRDNRFFLKYISPGEFKQREENRIFKKNIFQKTVFAKQQVLSVWHRRIGCGFFLSFKC